MGSLTDLYSHNISLILSALQSHGTLARHELADLTGLTRTTVSRAVSELAVKGVVREVDYGEASPRGGRKPIHLQLNDDAFCMIGLDLRREKISGCLVHLGGKLTSELSYALPEHPSQEEVLEQLHEVIDQLLDAARIPVMGIGLGTIGHVNTMTGVFRPQDFDSMYEVPLRSILHDRHGLPVSVRTGASTAAIGEYFARQQRGMAVQSLAFVVVDYGGLGLGIISDDVLWSNRSGLSEFGHIVIDYNGRSCGCGRHGCLTMYASGKATLSRLSELTGKSANEIGMAGLDELAGSGNRDAQQALVEAGYYLGYGITDVDCILHPEIIVLGSSHPNLAEWYMKGLLMHINESGSNIFGDDLSDRISLADKGSYAIAYGGAAMQIQQFYESPISIVEKMPAVNQSETLLR